MFQVNSDGTAVEMHAGDTGSFAVKATRSSGEDWTSADRMLFTIKGGEGIILQRYYRLDDDEGLGNGVMLIQFHNNDTDKWAPGAYSMERRYCVNPYWDGTAPEGMCVNALTAGVKMIEGDVVRTVVQGTLTIKSVDGEI